MIKKALQGVTMIELMLVVAIIGILMATAVLVYQTYTARSELSEPAWLQAPVGPRAPKSAKPATPALIQQVLRPGTSPLPAKNRTPV